MKTYEVFCYELDLCQVFNTQAEAMAFYTSLKEKHPKADINIYETRKLCEVQGEKK